MHVRTYTATVTTIESIFIYNYLFTYVKITPNKNLNEGSVYALTVNEIEFYYSQ